MRRDLYDGRSDDLYYHLIDPNDDVRYDSISTDHTISWRYTSGKDDQQISIQLFENTLQRHECKSQGYEIDIWQEKKRTWLSLKMDKYEVWKSCRDRFMQLRVSINWYSTNAVFSYQKKKYS